MNRELVLVRGLPGSGKSTYVRYKFFDYFYLEPDHITTCANGNYFFEPQLWNEIHDLTFKLADHVLAKSEKNVIISDVFEKKIDVNKYRELAKYHGVRFRVIKMNTLYLNVHKVPMTILQKFRDNWENIDDEEYIE
jgi:predicted kinase